jgi:lysophospholipase L1-like esterase
MGGRHRAVWGAALAALAWGALLTAGPAAGGGKKKNPAATPSPRLSLQPDPNWLKRHEGFVAIAKQGGVDVLFLGDSITDGWRGQPAWKKHFEPLKAANFGIGGDRTEHVLWRISHGELEGIQPKVAVLMIGTNNTGSNSAAQIAAGITAIVRKIEQLSPATKVLLLGVFPRGPKAGTPVRAKIAAINEEIAKLDDGKRVKYLDIGAKFTQPDGTLTKDIMPDYLHLSRRGYEIWAEAIAPTVNELLGGRPKQDK